MRKTPFFFFLIGILLSGACPVSALAQSPLDKKISISVKKTRLRKVLKIIEKKGDIKFSYSKSIIPVDRQVTYHADNQPISIVLAAILKPLGVSFSVVDNYIVLGRADIPEEPVKGQKSYEKKPLFTVSGNINDVMNGEVLIGATVLVEELRQGAVTNAYGFYSITLPAGEYTFSISYVGYQTQKIHVNLNKNTILDARLETDFELLHELVIDADRSLVYLENIRTGNTPVKPMEVSQMPGLMGEKDVIKSLEMVPGIKLYADGSTMFYVRGGNRDQNLILLDEAPIYNPSHILGLLSTIEADAAKDISIYKGDMPVQHGGRFSSLINISTNDGNMKKWSFGGTLGMASSNLSVEGPLKKDKSSFFLSGRLSNLQWLTSNILKIKSEIKFYDIYSKFNVRLNRNNRLFLTFYGGQDAFLDNSNSGITWGNVAASMRWNHIFNDRLFSNTTLYTSSYNYYLLTDAARDDAWHSGVSNLSLKSDFSYFINPSNSLYFGAEFRYHQFNPGNYEPADGQLPPDFPFVPKKNTNEIVLYAGNEQMFFSKLSIKYGLRMTAWLNVGPTTEIVYDDNYVPVAVNKIDKGELYNSYINFSPRLGIAWQFSPRLSAKLFYNRTVQNIHLITNSISPFTNFEVWMPSAPNIRPQEADQVGGGIFVMWPSAGLKLSGEVFYKWLYNQIDYKDHASMILNPLIEGTLRFGNGRAYGGEIALEKETGRLTGRLGYAYLRSFLRVNGVNDFRQYPTYADRPHEILLFLNYRFGKRWDLGLNWFYSTGASITTPTGFYIYESRTVPYYSERGNDRLPDYHRLDLSLSFHLSRREAPFQHQINLTVYNAYNRRNPVYVNFNKTARSVEDTTVPADYVPLPALYPTITYLYGFIPSISYTFKL